MVFSEKLREIADEQTEFVEVPTKSGDRELLIRSKAEALARFVWRAALGYEEMNDTGDKIKHEPDKWAVGLLFDRLEGKIVAAATPGKTGISIADRVSEQGKKALNKLADA